ncbi:MAG: glycosyltransferase family 39 protein [Phycisphaerae bacterium]
MHKGQRFAGRRRETTSLLFGAGLTLSIIVAALVRLDGLTSRELWFDENCTFYAVHHVLNWPADGPDPRRELAHIPYFLLLHAWTQLVGETAWGLRSFSAAVGCVGVLAVGMLAARMCGRRTALIAAALAALNPLHVYYSQEARVYTTWTAEIILGLYCLYMAAATLRTRWWAAYVGAMWLTTLTHYYTLLWLPASIAAVALSSDLRRFLRQWLLTNAVLAIALCPMIWLLIMPLGEGGPRTWLRETWMSYPPAWAIPRSLWALLPAGAYPDYLGALAVAHKLIETRAGALISNAVLVGPGAFMLIGGLVAAWRMIRPSRGGGTEAPRSTQAGHRTSCGQPRLMLFLMGHVAAFLLLAFCYSSLVRPVYIVGRYDIAAWPAVTIAFASLVDAAGRRVRAASWARAGVRAALTAVWLACSVVMLAGARAAPVNNEIARRAERIAAAVGPDDLVVSVAMYRWFMAYEWSRLAFHPDMVSFPPAHDRQLCWDDPQAELADRRRHDADVATVITRIDRAFAAGRRVWLIAHGEPTGPRWSVDQHFFAALHRTGVEVRPYDEWAGLAELLRSSSYRGPDAAAPTGNTPNTPSDSSNTR